MHNNNWYKDFISDNIFDNIEYYLSKNNLDIPDPNDIDDIAIMLHVNHKHAMYSDYIMFLFGMSLIFHQKRLHCSLRRLSEIWLTASKLMVFPR